MFPSYTEISPLSSVLLPLAHPVPALSLAGKVTKPQRVPAHVLLCLPYVQMDLLLHGIWKEELQDITSGSVSPTHNMPQLKLQTLTLLSSHPCQLKMYIKLLLSMQRGLFMGKGVGEDGKDLDWTFLSGHFGIPGWRGTAHGNWEITAFNSWVLWIQLFASVKWPQKMKWLTSLNISSSELWSQSWKKSIRIVLCSGGSPDLLTHSPFLFPERDRKQAVGFCGAVDYLASLQHLGSEIQRLRERERRSMGSGRGDSLGQRYYPNKVHSCLPYL